MPRIGGSHWMSRSHSFCPLCLDQVSVDLDLPKIQWLHHFCVAATHTSFRSAARDLGVTDEVVSRSIRSLEKHIGLRLFERGNRSGKKAKLTRAGELALGPISQIVYMAGQLAG